jgi:PAS domain S-box-containing protein
MPTSHSGPDPIPGPRPDLTPIGPGGEPGRALEAMQRSERRYRRLFETAKDGILILDADSGRVLEANPFMTELLGYDLGHFLGKELWEIGVFGDKDANQAASAILKKDGYIRYEHLPLKTRAGDQVEVEFVSNVYREGDEKVIQCNIRDISERRALELQMKLQAEVLAEVSQRKDEFLAMLSHELRNPLGSILNSIQILRLRREDDPVQQRARAALERQAGQMTHLVNDLLEVSRLTTGKVALRIERQDMRAVVGRALESTRHEVEKHGHTLTLNQPQGPLWVHADPVRLEQVVVNLLSNASKYTDDGGSIGVDVEREGEEVVLRVRDTGIGIEASLLPRVFDLFAQADRSLLRSQGGLGIGLALVRRLVEMHGGTVEARSEGLRRGCEFVVRLPAATSSTRGGAAEPKPEGLRVLVVDDNVDYAEGVATLLRAAGHTVEVAYSGRDALISTSGARPDVVILDIGMPGMDGYEVARRLREEPGSGEMRVVGLSGYKQAEEGPLTRGARFDEFFLKPVLFEQLEASLRR